MSKALIVVTVTANFVLLAITVFGFFVSTVGYDWLIFREAGERVGRGSLYDWTGSYAWSYSPLLAYAFAVIAPLGLVIWSLLHFAALAILRSRWLALLTVLSWPFWVDVYNGNTMTFVFVAGATALGGNSVATGGYLLLCLLMPRPVMLPLMIWILWRRPAWRLPFVLLLVANAVAIAATGDGVAWAQSLFRVGDVVSGSSYTIGPSLILGRVWILIGAVLAVILTIRGRVGWASLAASPYWLPQYFLMLMLELVPDRLHPSRQGPDEASRHARGALEAPISAAETQRIL